MSEESTSIEDRVARLLSTEQDLVITQGEALLPLEGAIRGCAGRAVDDLGRIPEGGPMGGVEVSLRRVYLHMIEEYARHNGHADIPREHIDGVTGA